MGEKKSLVYNVTRSENDTNHNFLLLINGHQLHECGNAESGFVTTTADELCELNDGLINELHVLVITGKESINGSIITCKTGQSRSCPNDTDITVIVYDDGRHVGYQFQ